jgi:glycosyltransferase involved in cell wall biosynthesis
MKPIRVLHILEGLHAGGMESMIMNYFRNIDLSKVIFDFLIFSEKSFYDDEVENLGGKIFRITPRRKNPLKNYMELDKFFKENTEYKIIHIHQGINYFAPLKMAKKYKVPFRIVHSHGMDPTLIKRQWLFYNFYTLPTIRKLGTHFFACSNQAAKQLFDKSIYNENRFNVFPNSINAGDFTFDINKRVQIREKLKLNNFFVIGHVGNFSRVKNHDFILEVFKDVYKKNKNARLLLVGGGTLEDEIKKKVNDMNLDHAIKFMGIRNDVQNLMQIMDVLLFPSLYEGLPVTLIEAQAAGLNCIVSDTITRETEITDHIQYISLNKPSSYWANIVLNSSLLENRNKSLNSIVSAGFDINTAVIQLENIYLNLR